MQDGKRIGFTSFINDEIRCNCLPDEEYRLKMIIESYLGQMKNVTVMLKTIGMVSHKHPRTVSRILSRLRAKTTLTMKKRGKIYVFSTIDDTGVMYGKTLMSRLMVHGCPHIKRKETKEFIKNKSISSKKNVIQMDPDYQTALTLDRSTDNGYRSFNSKLDLLDQRYPAWKYEKEWDEARKLLFEPRPTRAIEPESESKLK